MHTLRGWSAVEFVDHGRLLVEVFAVACPTGRQVCYKSEAALGKCRWFRSITGQGVVTCNAPDDPCDTCEGPEHDCRACEARITGDNAPLA